MNTFQRTKMIGVFIFTLSLLVGCEGTIKKRVKPINFLIPVIEAEWIVKGEPIEFEGELWFPQDSIENLMDEEVYLMGRYAGVQFFVEKRDVRPYDRLYTKFGKNKFRVFKKRHVSD